MGGREGGKEGSVVERALVVGKARKSSPALCTAAVRIEATSGLTPLTDSVCSLRALSFGEAGLPSASASAAAVHSDALSIDCHLQDQS